MSERTSGTDRPESGRKTAFVTGASRGIGKAIAIALAENGFDVAITARTVQSGESRERSTTVGASDTRPLPGSLRETAAEIEKAGGAALAVPADLLDLTTVSGAIATVLERWGDIDLLVNNGFYVGPGLMDEVVDTPVRLFQEHLTANALAPLTLVKAVLPRMLERGSGTLINITSGAGYSDPPAKAGAGGWSLAYAMSKAAMHRIAGVVKHEVGEQKIYIHNVHPGFVTTERGALDMAEYGFDASAGAPPAVVGAVVAWIAADPAGCGPNGSTFEAQDVCAERNLLPGWQPAATA